MYVAGDNRNDPLLNTTQCQIDAEHLKNVGANAVYIYSIDVSKLGQHRGCMEEFDKQGIYVWLQLGQLPMVLSRVCFFDSYLLVTIHVSNTVSSER